MGIADRLALAELSYRDAPRNLSCDLGHVPLHEEGEAELKDAAKQQNDDRQHEGEFDRRHTVAIAPK